MNELEKLAKLQLRLPKGLKRGIWEKTDFKTRNTIVPRFVQTIEIWHEKLLLRTFAFVSNTRKRNYEDILIREVYRELEGYSNTLMRDVWYDNYLHRVEFDKSWQDKHFYVYTGVKWNFYSYQMYDKQEIIEKLNIPYCQWFNPKNNSNLSFFDYICKYRKEPKIELLVKADLSHFISGLRYLDLSKKSIDQIFKIDKKWVNELKNMNVKLLLIARKYTFANNIHELKYIDKINKNNKFIKKYLNRRMLDYINKHEQVFLATYNDYLRFTEELGADMNNFKILCPSNLTKEHDRLANEFEVSKSEIQDRKIKERANKFKKLIYEDDSFCLFPVSSTEELIEESKTLQHCVRTYASLVAKGKTEIMFVRKKEEKDTPLYTLELKGKRIVQFRAKNNYMPSEKAISFVKKWSKKNKLQCDL